MAFLPVLQFCRKQVSILAFPTPPARIIGGGDICLLQEVVRTDASLHSPVIDEAAHLLRYSSVFNTAFSV